MLMCIEVNFTSPKSVIQIIRDDRFVFIECETLLLPRVRVKASVTTPKYKWGSVSHQSIGIVSEVIASKQDVYVDFPEQKKWTGHISEMEKVCFYSVIREII